MKYFFPLLFMSLVLAHLQIIVPCAYGQEIRPDNMYISPLDTAKVEYIFAQLIAIDATSYSFRKPEDYNKAFFNGDIKFKAHFFKLQTGYPSIHVFYGTDYGELFTTESNKDSLNLIYGFSRKSRPMLIAVNTINYEFHRVSGFSNTDVLSLYLDTRDYVYDLSGKKLSLRKFLKSTYIEGVNIRSIYSELKKELKGKKGVYGNQYYRRPY